MHEASCLAITPSLRYVARSASDNSVSSICSTKLAQGRQASRALKNSRLVYLKMRFLTGKPTIILTTMATRKNYKLVLEILSNSSQNACFGIDVMQILLLLSSCSLSISKPVFAEKIMNRFLPKQHAQII